MTRAKIAFCAAVSSLSMAACVTGNSPAVTAGDIRPYTGCREQAGCYVGGEQVASSSDIRYDNRVGRRYFVDESTGRTYWENGDYRR